MNGTNPDMHVRIIESCDERSGRRYQIEVSTYGRNYATIMGDPNDADMMDVRDILNRVYPDPDLPDDSKKFREVTGEEWHEYDWCVCDMDTGTHVERVRGPILSDPDHNGAWYIERSISYWVARPDQSPYDGVENLRVFRHIGY